MTVLSVDDGIAQTLLCLGHVVISLHSSNEPCELLQCYALMRAL